MKQIGIVTIFDCDNYGADLQAYALPIALKALGYEAEVIDYPFYKSRRFHMTSAGRPVLPLSFQNRLKEVIGRLLAKLIHFCGGTVIRRREQAFAAFREKIPRSKRTYASFDALLREPPVYDVYMTGSDQVWNPRMGASLRPYFLDFLPESTRRIAYAASFGVADLSAPVATRYRVWLSRYQAIGCREPQGVELVRKLCPGVPAVHTLDPTLLLSREAWSAVATFPKTVNDKPYLLIYELVPAHGLSAFAHRWADRQGLEIVRICASNGTHGTSNETLFRDLGPDGFIGLFAKASAIVTTSFHGTVFSLIFGVPFYSVIPGKMRNSSRQRELLKTVGCPNRLLSETELTARHPEDSLDWPNIQRRLQAARETSLAFLTSSVEGGDYAS